MKNLHSLLAIDQKHKNRIFIEEKPGPSRCPSFYTVVYTVQYSPPPIDYLKSFYACFRPKDVEATLFPVADKPIRFINADSSRLGVVSDPGFPLYILAQGCYSFIDGVPNWDGSYFCLFMAQTQLQLISPFLR
jgi:hypothetical protein